MCTITNNKLHNMLLMLLLCDVLDPVTYHFKLNTQTLYNFTFIKRNDRQVSKQNFQFWTLHDRRARTSSDFQTIRWVETQTLWTPSLRLLPALPAKHIIIINHHHHHRSCRRHQQQQTATNSSSSSSNNKKAGRSRQCSETIRSNQLVSVTQFASHPLYNMRHTCWSALLSRPTQPRNPLWVPVTAGRWGH